MKKIKEPNLKVIKFESMDVIATSSEVKVSGVGENVAKGYTIIWK